jgi:glutathione S-transferase
MITLLSSPLSPFVRTIRVLLLETGQDDVALTEVATTPMATDTAVAAANPVGKIPVLLRADGPAIYDSRVIARYLNARAGAGLYPDARIWETLTLEATAHGIMEAALAMTYEKRVRPEGMQHQPWIEAQWDKAARALDAVEARWMSHLSGPMDMGHIAMGCALGYIDFRHGDRDWRKGRDALTTWEAAFATRPAMQATIPAA